MNFSDLNISESLKGAIKRKGFVNPSEIQEKVIPIALSGKDLVGKAKTGTGKTAAFGIPLIEKIKQGHGCSALIVVPTRELALQVKEEISSLATASNIKTIAVFGGQNIQRQAELIRRQPEIIVGTPGRLLDLIERQILHFDKAKFLVLDEADKMFDMGFRDDIKLLVTFFPKERQTMLFSATMSKEVLELANKHLKHDKVMVDVSEDESPVKEIQQFYVMVDHKQKADALIALLAKERDSKTLVFCRTKRTVDWLERQLYRSGIKALAIHGDKKQNHRNKTIELYKNDHRLILIATDIVSRGIHVEDINHVINFDFPEAPETYIHRIGRTARQGKKGIAISFCTNMLELDQLRRIGHKSNAEIKELPLVRKQPIYN